MPGTFSGIETARRALVTQQLALNVIGSNIANANTEGYSRQVPLITSTSPLGLPAVASRGQGLIGTGAVLKSVYRLRSEYVETQIRSQYMDLSAWQVMGNILERVSTVFNQDMLKLSQAIEDFGAAFGQLGRAVNADTVANVAISGGDTSFEVGNGSLWKAGDQLNVGGEVVEVTGVAGNIVTISGVFAGGHAIGTAVSLAVGEDVARGQVNSRGDALTQLFHQSWQQLDLMALEANEQVKDYVGKANDLLQEIARLNGEVSRTQAGGVNPNDYLDARDLALRQLAQIINFDTHYNRDGSVNVVLGGSSLVNGQRYATLETLRTTPTDGRFLEVSMRTIGSNQEIVLSSYITGGALSGFIQARDGNLQYYTNKLNELAHSLMNQVNIIHSASYAKDWTTTNVDFFVGMDARDISVNGVITADNNFALLSVSNTSSASANPINAKNALLLEDLSLLLMNKIKASGSAVCKIPPPPAPVVTVDPFQPIGGQLLLFDDPPLIDGTTWIDGVPVNWGLGDSIEDIVNRVNDTVPNVKMVFNETTQKFFILSANYVDIVDSVGTFLDWTDLRTRVVSGSIVGKRDDIDYLALNPSLSLNDQNNLLAFAVTPAAKGSFTINGVTIDWVDQLDNPPSPFGLDGLPASLNEIIAKINAVPGVEATFVYATQELVLTSQQDIEIVDVTGNFTAFANLYNVGRHGDFAAAISSESKYDGMLSADQIGYLHGGLDGLIAQQEALGGVNTDVELADILKYEKAYNAAVQVLSVMDSILNTLINRMGGGGGTVSFGNSD